MLMVFLPIFCRHCFQKLFISYKNVYSIKNGYNDRSKNNKTLPKQKPLGGLMNLPKGAVTIELNCEATISFLEREGVRGRGNLFYRKGFSSPGGCIAAAFSSVSGFLLLSC